MKFRTAGRISSKLIIQFYIVALMESIYNFQCMLSIDNANGFYRTIICTYFGDWRITAAANLLSEIIQLVAVVVMMTMMSYSQTDGSVSVSLSADKYWISCTMED